MSKIKKWKLLGSTLAFDNPWYKVRQDKVQLPDGKIIDDFFVSLHPDVVLVFPVTRDNQVVFVRQYKHGAGEILLELPAGTYDKNREDPQTAARRELLEETGFKAKMLISLGKIQDYPTKDTHKISLFIAPSVEYVGRRHAEPTEHIEVIKFSLRKVLELAYSGKLKASSTVAATFLAIEHLKCHPKSISTTLKMQMLSIQYVQVATCNPS